jgi:DNA invertase Pin-like site-specific DNA recombinase
MITLKLCHYTGSVEVREAYAPANAKASNSVDTRPGKARVMMGFLAVRCRLERPLTSERLSMVLSAAYAQALRLHNQPIVAIWIVNAKPLTPRIISDLIGWLDVFCFQLF